MATISIYDAARLKLQVGTPLYDVLYFMYIRHQELDENVAKRAAKLLSGSYSYTEILNAIYKAEKEIQ